MSLCHCAAVPHAIAVLSCLVITTAGPSGAGKSSLLNILAGRTSSSGSTKVTGKFRVNGKEVDPVKFRSRIAYVMQEDTLYATQTPREALHFSAALRLPKTTTVAERTQLVENIISSLGLTKCADTPIGNHRACACCVASPAVLATPSVAHVAHMCGCGCVCACLCVAGCGWVVA